MGAVGGTAARPQAVQAGRTEPVMLAAPRVVVRAVYSARQVQAQSVEPTAVAWEVCPAAVLAVRRWRWWALWCVRRLHGQVGWGRREWWCCRRRLWWHRRRLIRWVVALAACGLATCRFAMAFLAPVPEAGMAEA